MDLLELIKFAIQELSVTTGISPTIIGAVLVMSMAGMVGTLTSRVVDSSFGMILGGGPLLLGVLVGLIPLWIALIGSLLGLFLILSSLFELGRPTSSIPKEEEDEVQTDPAQARKLVQKRLESLALDSKPGCKPPWSK